jgi:hypothetical protein
MNSIKRGTDAATTPRSTLEVGLGLLVSLPMFDVCVATDRSYPIDRATHSTSYRTTEIGMWRPSANAASLSPWPTPSLLGCCERLTYIPLDPSIAAG